MKYYLDFWFDILLKVTEVKVQYFTIIQHISLLFELEYSNVVLICIDMLVQSIFYKQHYLN
jgi:hypothetical protein